MSLLVISSSSLLNAQVTVGANTTPSATLDVVAADPTNATIPEGVIAPRLTGNQIKAKDNYYLGPQNGAIVYATAAANPTSAKTVNITSPGYYCYDAPNSIWRGIGQRKLNVVGELDVDYTAKLEDDIILFTTTELRQLTFPIVGVPEGKTYYVADAGMFGISLNPTGSIRFSTQFSVYAGLAATFMFINGQWISFGGM